MRRADSGPASACKVHVLDLSKLARFAGVPACSEDDFVVDPLEGLVVPHPRFLGKQARRKPQKGAEWMYPHQYSPHSQSHWAGPWYVPNPAAQHGPTSCFTSAKHSTKARGRHWGRYLQVRYPHRCSPQWALTSLNACICLHAAAWRLQPSPEDAAAR